MVRLIDWTASGALAAISLAMAAAVGTRSSRLVTCWTMLRR